MCSIRRVVTMAVALAVLFGTQRELAAGTAAQSKVHALLDVPYVSQTPELCGGAAVAMVLRYWGERDVFAQDFASLAGGDGIPTGTLASAVLDRGWQALVLPAAAESARVRVRSEIDQGRPLIALIEVALRTYHYVVVVGSTDQDVVVHDPARAPFRVLTWAEFDRAWTATGRWAMLVLPPSGFRSGHVAMGAPASSRVADLRDQTPCDAMVERSVSLALAGEPEEAERGLVVAAHLCPTSAAAWLELAGLRFSQSRWQEAAGLSRSATRLAPDDAYAWQLLATSRHLSGDAMGALDAWNHVGEPRIDAIDVRGTVRTQHPVIVRASGLQPRQLLTPEAYKRALRRLRDVPAAESAAMRYQPVDGGLTTVDVFFAERRIMPRGWLAFASLGARALVLDELAVGIAGGMGVGERETLAWRWAAGRPRVAVDLALPLPRGFRGILALEGSWERQSYPGRSPGGAPVQEDRRRLAAHLADWSTSWLRWQTGAALERWSVPDDQDTNLFQSRDHLAVEGAIDARLSGDRLALAASGGWWEPFAGGDRFGTGELLAAWRSTPDATHTSWSATTGLEVVGGAAPLGLWHGAGTGQGRSGLLRAHPLLSGGVLNGPVFGREVAHGSLESTRPIGGLSTGGVSIAAFVDAARAWHRPSSLDPSPLYVDAGVGVRLHGPGPEGTVRIDIAHGLRGGGTTLSAAWGGRWPR